MIELLLIRHSESDKNVEGRHGHSEGVFYLTEKGKKEVSKLNSLLKKNVSKIDSVYTSKTIASIETGIRIADFWKLKLNVKEQINSLDMGVLSGLSFEEMSSKYPNLYKSINLYENGMLHPKYFDIPKAEKLDDFEDRIKSELLQILNENKDNATVIVIAHRSTITMICNLIWNKFIPASKRFYRKIKLPLLSITSLRIDKSNIQNSIVKVVGKKTTNYFKKEYSLGINFSTHDSSICISKNGKIIFAAEEERFNREKRTREFPTHSLLYAQNNFNISDYNFKAILIPNNPVEFNLKDLKVNPSKEIAEQEYQDKKKYELIHLQEILNSKGVRVSNNTKIKYYSHHLCHAASAFFLSNYSTSIILTIDGMGEKQTMGFYMAKNGELTLVDSSNFPNSIGKVYGAVSRFLGYWGPSKEGKVMALASLSSKKSVKEKFFYFDNGIFPKLNSDLFDLSISSKKPSITSKRFHEIFGPPREPGKKLNEKHLELAWNIQHQLEQTVKEIIIRISKTAKGQSNFCLSGGVFLNCKLNGFLTKEFLDYNFFIPPYPHDGGLPIGAVSLIDSSKLKSKKQAPFFGFGDEIKGVPILAKEKKLQYFKLKKPYKTGALLIDKFGVLGWFQGNSEFGPRALGNRSIIGNPTDIRIKQKINEVLKEREYFRPFAPAILDEKTSEVFLTDEYLPFMTKGVSVKDNWKNIIPAVIHFDNSSRIQTVNKNFNESFYKLIKEFYKLTKIPLVLNTSFNRRDEPIVNTIDDAINTFTNTKLEVMVIGNYLIYKSSVQEEIELIIKKKRRREANKG